MLKVVCIGAGRLAFHLMPALEQAGCRVIQVYNRTEASAQALLAKLQQPLYTSIPEEISAEGDLYIFALKDDVVGPLASQLRHLEKPDKIFVHASGVLGLDVLPFKRKGSFYPLQTFSVNHEIPWSSTPILITTGNQEVHDVLFPLAQKISGAVYTVSDEQKSILHLSAVFANNFTNHMLTLAEKICVEHQVSFDILKPLIRETIAKALDVGPASSQTGPAVRGDQNTIDRHLRLLAGDALMTQVYQIVTESILFEKVKDKG